MHPYYPEGNECSTPTPEELQKSLGTDRILCARCIKCDEYQNLHVDLGGIKGIIPREETALGLAEGRTKPIAVLSRVGKTVSFQMLGFDSEGNAILSRRAAQAEARSFFFSALHPGDIIPAKVLNPTDLGVFCDIGCGFTALMRIDRCCVSRLRSTDELYYPGQDIFAAIWNIDDDLGRIELTGRELLGTWEENAAHFRPGQTVTGTVRSIMPYGIFVELLPNLSGLTEPKAGISPGDRVSVYIRSILPHRHKLKLSILEVLPKEIRPGNFCFMLQSGNLRSWEYYPGSKCITVF